MKFVALISIVPEEREEEAIKLAKEAGAGSVTIIRGRNLGLKEKKIFFGLTLEESVSLLLFVLPRRISLKVLRALVDGMNIKSNDNSYVAFTIPIEHVAGLNIEELHKFESEIRNLI